MSANAKKFVAIQIAHLIPIKKALSDLYLQINPQKFLKIYRQYDDLEIDRLKKFQNLNKRFLYIHHEDQKFYQKQTKKMFTPVRISTLIPGSQIPFALYRQEDQRSLFLAAQSPYTPSSQREIEQEHLRKLFIEDIDEMAYQKYIDESLPLLLQDRSLNRAERAEVLSHATMHSVQNVYQNFDHQGMQKMTELSRNLSEFAQTAKELPADEDDESTENEGEENISSEQLALKELMNLRQTGTIYQHAMNVSNLALGLLDHIFRLRFDSQKRPLVKMFDQQLLNNQDTKDLVVVSALLHDIGKQDLLDKKLGQQEIHEQHSALGATKITSISDSTIHNKIAEIIMQHEEFCDGSGVPKKIYKAEMSIYAQIISLVNYYENCRHQRDMEEKAALADIKKYESKFNKYLIPVFFDLLS